MLMETAVLQGKNYEVYLKWAKWLMIMGFVCIMMQIFLWKFLDWDWILSGYSWGRRETVRPYAYSIVTVAYLLQLLGSYILRKYPNTIYRTFANRLMIAWGVNLLFNTFWWIAFYFDRAWYTTTWSFILSFVPIAILVWAYSTLMDDNRIQHVATWSICLFLEWGIGNIHDIQSWSWIIWLIIDILNIFLWKSLFTTQTDMEINLNLKRPAWINRAFVGFIIVCVIYFSFLEVMGL